MRNHIIFFSGGKASFKVAWWVKKHHPEDNILLLFTDTSWEDEDLYRFIDEVSDKLELPLLKLKHGKNPKELMIDDNFLYNSRVANCSYKLKVVPAKKYIKKGEFTPTYEYYNEQYLKDKEGIRDNPILYFGIDYKEAHRMNAIVKNWKPYECVSPLMEEDISDGLFEEYGIEIPKLYKQGFSHNNCGGRCIKGGQGHWLTLYKKDRDRFDEMRDFEQAMNVQINEYKGTEGVKYSFMKKKNEPYWLTELEEDQRDRPEQLDLFDFGVCGCFIDEDMIDDEEEEIDFSIKLTRES